ncbi:MAG: MFS transporter [Proteobacteria bacterium]|nr:MFS transporter [Pseudomonadota bacterium]MDA0844435.1 MFS transporter [Pseudomonadota bacterium]
MPTLLLVVFINFVGIGALIPVLPYTVIETLGLSATVMTLLLASFAMAMFLSNPLLGRLSDHIGRRPVLIASLLVNALAHLWFAFSDDIIQMFAARILAGLAAGNTGVIQAIIADRVASHQRARYMGLFGAAIGTGFVAGPALGGLLSGVGSGPLHQAPFLLAAGFSFLALALSVRIEESAAHRQVASSAKQPLVNRLATIMRSPLALYALAFFCLNLSFAQVEASFVLLLRDYLDFDARQTGWLFTYIGVCIILVQGGLINSAVRRFGEVGTVGFGASLLVVGQILTAVMAVGLLIGNGYPLVQMLIVTTAVCFGFGFSNPALSAAASNAAGKTTMGGALGMVQGFGSLGQVGGLVLAGPLYHLGGVHYSFGFGAAITLILLAVAFHLRQRPVSV